MKAATFLEKLYDLGITPSNSRPREQIIEAAKAANPQRWSEQIRNLSLPESVTLNPEKAASC
jgi:hypothetical protein